MRRFHDSGIKHPTCIHLAGSCGEAILLASALLNLAVNARDAMADGGMITTSARKRLVRKGEIQELAAGDYVCLSVTDEGEGMDAETLENSMAPFFTTKGIGKGTGLGLPMVQGLMAQSGGKLRLRSVKGEGTTAEMWLPVAEVVEQPAVEVPQVVVHPDRALTVLVVDDDPLVITNTILMLEDLRHEVVQAHSGEEALPALSRDEEFDLVLTDHSMPKMTGAQIRSDPPPSSIVSNTRAFEGWPYEADARPVTQLQATRLNGRTHRLVHILIRQCRKNPASPSPRRLPTRD